MVRLTKLLPVRDRQHNSRTIYVSFYCLLFRDFFETNLWSKLPYKKVPCHSIRSTGKKVANTIRQMCEGAFFALNAKQRLAF
jgi:hypothetical protein